MNDLNQIIDNQIIDQADADERETFDTIAALRMAFLGDGGDGATRTDWRITEMYEALNLARDLINAVASHTGATGVFGPETCRYSPEALGMMIMQNLPNCEGRMSVDRKAYWMTVAETLGPDWVESFRTVGAFMKRVDSF